MQINQHNYEEFFLLYIDNELSVQEREMVEDFLKQNPELAGELDLLKQTVSAADNAIQFGSKESLARTGAIGQEELLLYLDGEAGPGLSGKIEQEVLTDEHLRSELEEWRQLYVKPDLSVTYPSRQKLYKGGVIRRLDWRKLAIAASLLLCISTWLILNQSEQESHDGNIAFNDSPVVSQPAEPVTPVTDTVADADTPAPDVAEETRTEHNRSDKGSLRRQTVEPGTASAAQPPIAPSGATELVNTRPADADNKVPIKQAPPTQLSGTSRPVPEPVTEPASVAPVPPPVTSVAAPVKEKKSLLKKIGEQISDRALDILTDGGDHINVAGFAIRVEK